MSTAMGISADGIAESMEETTQPPWLLGQLIEVATADLHPSVFIVLFSFPKNLIPC